MTAQSTTEPSATANLILCEYQRRLTHIVKRQPEPGSELDVQVRGELIGLRGALGIALGGQVQGGVADRLAGERYAEWENSEEASSAVCNCSACTEVDAA